MQAKLLRALQEKEIQRVGGTRPIKIDVRVLAATNRELEAMVKDNRFREDLYYRLNVIPITVPPLRQRREDTDVLIDYFLNKHATAAARHIKVSSEARKVLLDYAWPGNVRQLESAIERALLLAEGDEITLEDLPLEIRQTTPAQAVGGFKLPPEGISFEELERSLIIQAMEQTGWNITRAAELPRTFVPNDAIPPRQVRNQKSRHVGKACCTASKAVQRASRILPMLLTILLLVAIAPFLSPTQSADLILHNGAIYTVNARKPWAEAVAIKGDRIVAVGSDKDVMRLRSAQTRVIDLERRFALPGFDQATMSISRRPRPFSNSISWRSGRRMNSSDV